MMRDMQRWIDQSFDIMGQHPGRDGSVVLSVERDSRMHASTTYSIALISCRFLGLHTIDQWVFSSLLCLYFCISFPYFDTLRAMQVLSLGVVFLHQLYVVYCFLHDCRKNLLLLFCVFVWFGFSCWR